MGSIPEYKSRSPIDQPVDKSLFGQAQVTGQIGQGVGGLLNQASGIVYKAQMAKEALEKDIYVKRGYLDTEERLNNLDREIKKDPVFVQNPKKGIEKWISRSKALIEDVAGSAPFPSAKKAYKDVALEMQLRGKEKMEIWGDELTLQKADFTNNKLAGLKATDVYLNPFDDDLYKGSLNDVAMIADSYNLTMDPSLVDKKNREYRQKLVSAKFKGAIDMVDKLLDAGPLPGESYNQMIGRANAIMKKTDEMLAAKDENGNSLYEYDLGPEGVSNVRSMIKRLAEKKTAVGKGFEHLRRVDPDKYFEKLGIAVPNVDPKNLGASIAAKAAAINRLNSKLKTSAGLINKGDIAEMNRFLESASPSQIIKSFRTMEVLPDELRHQYVREFAKQNMPIAYLANSLAIGEMSDAMAEEVLRGRELLKKDKTTGVSGVLMPRRSEFQSKLDEIVATRLQNPLEKKTVSQLAFQALAADRARRQETEPDFNDGDEEALNQIISDYIGTPLSWNGTEIIGPKGVPVQEVENVLDSISDESLKASFGVLPVNERGNPIGIENNRGDLKLVPTEIRGVFELKFKGQPLYFPKTKLPYRFSLDEYYHKQPDEVKKRSRGWFRRMLGR